MRVARGIEAAEIGLANVQQPPSFFIEAQERAAERWALGERAICVDQSNLWLLARGNGTCPFCV
jgi:hypothetical protein